MNSLTSTRRLIQSFLCQRKRSTQQRKQGPSILSFQTLAFEESDHFGFKSYPNHGTRVFLHNTRNLRGRVADNKHFGIDIGNTGGILVQDFRIAVISTAFHSVIATQNLHSPCRTGRLHFIELQTWQTDSEHQSGCLSRIPFRLLSRFRTDPLRRTPRQEFSWPSQLCTE